MTFPATVPIAPPRPEAPPESPASEAWDYATLVIEDEQPVDSLISEKQQRLAVNALYSSYRPGVAFLAAANVGLFYAAGVPPVVPDVMVSLGVEIPEDWAQKQNRSYVVAVLGKPPELAIEVVSNAEGHELDRKFTLYARAAVRYYVVFDPLRLLSDEVLQAFELVGETYQRLPDAWFEGLQLGLCLWDGRFEQRNYLWLRWCDEAGRLLLTGDEQAEQERQQTEQERQRTEQQRQRAERAEQLAAELAARLRDLGEGGSPD